MILVVIFFFDNSTYAVNEFDGYLETVRYWVPELPPPKEKLSLEKEKEFKTVWVQVGVASKNLLTAWEELRKDDPLSDRALKALNRYEKIQPQNDQLRIKLIREYGKKKFKKMEREGRKWLKTQENEWLDLEDRELIGLIVWQYKMNDYQSLKEEPFLQFIKNKEGELTDEEAIEVYKAGMELIRQQNREKKTESEIPDRVLQYLTVHAEADYLFSAGDTYLRLTQRPKIEVAFKEYMEVWEKAYTLRPDVYEALAEINKDKFPKPPEEFKWPSRKFMFVTLNFVLILIIILVLLYRSKQKTKFSNKE